MKLTFSSAFLVLLMSSMLIVLAVVIQESNYSAHFDPNFVTSLGRAFAAY